MIDLQLQIDAVTDTKNIQVWKNWIFWNFQFSGHDLQSAADHEAHWQGRHGNVRLSYFLWKCSKNLFFIFIVLYGKIMKNTFFFVFFKIISWLLFQEKLEDHTAGPGEGPPHRAGRDGHRHARPPPRILRGWCHGGGRFWKAEISWKSKFVEPTRLCALWSAAEAVN